MKRNSISAILCCGVFVSGLASAQDKEVTKLKGESDAAQSTVDSHKGDVAAAAMSGDESNHEELRALRVALTEALKKGDVAGQLAHVHKNVVATWQNNRVVRGQDGLRKFLDEINAQNKEVFRGYKVEPQVDELTILYGGDTGIAFGKSVPQYHYAGMDFELENRWTATLVKEDGGWKIAAYHVSANVVDNPVLNIAKQSAYWVGGICLVMGMVVGGIGTSMLRRRQPPRE